MYSSKKRGLALVNANVITMDPQYPRANAVLILGGKIAGVCGTPDRTEFHGEVKTIIDCKGKTILPGFVDPHLHLLAYAETLMTLNLTPRSNIRSIQDIQFAIAQWARNLPTGTWIRATGYDEQALHEGRHPNRWELDVASPSHPIKLTHRTGHAHVLNSQGLKLVGLSRESGDPEGGLMERDLSSGEPTGLLFEMGDFLSRRVPHLELKHMERGIERASRELLSFGITAVQDASHRNDLERWSMFEKWKRLSLFKPGLSMMLGIKAFHSRETKDLKRQEGSSIHFGGIKIILDETTGSLYPVQEELDEMVFQIHQSGRQAVIHAIGERSLKSAILAIGHAHSKAPRRDSRHRIEHASICPPTLVRRLKSCEIVVVTQPSFIHDRGDRYLETVPAHELRDLYPIRRLLEGGVCVAGSSDCPVARPNPLTGIHSAVTRMSETGKEVLSEEAIAAADALGLYTTHAARAGFQEQHRGVIQAGRAADLVVLNADPTGVPVEEIKHIQVDMTVLGGEIVWERTPMI